jgi:hypothetical protein
METFNSNFDIFDRLDHYLNKIFKVNKGNFFINNSIEIF